MCRSWWSVPRRDHLLQINGDMFTDPSGLNPIAPTDGAFTVLVREFVSNTSAVKDGEITQSRKLLEADQVYDHGAGVLHYYDRGTTTDLIPAKTIVGTSQGQNASATE